MIDKHELMLSLENVLPTESPVIGICADNGLFCCECYNGTFWLVTPVGEVKPIFVTDQYFLH